MVAKVKRKWLPEHHPRDARGRFTRSSTRVMQPADRKRAAAGQAGFKPAELGDGAARADWLQRASTATPSAGGRISAYLDGGWRTDNPAMRAGKPVDDVAQLDEAFTPLTEDVVLRRVVPSAMFAHIPINQLVGMKVRDAAPASMSLDHEGPGHPGAVTMHIAAPAGTRVYVNDDAGEVLAIRDTEVAITRAVPRPDGNGWDLYGVVIPRTDSPARPGKRAGGELGGDTDPAAASADTGGGSDGLSSSDETPVAGTRAPATGEDTAGGVGAGSGDNGDGDGGEVTTTAAPAAGAAAADPPLILWKDAETGRPVYSPGQPEIVRKQVVRDPEREERVRRGMAIAAAAMAGEPEAVARAGARPPGDLEGDAPDADAPDAPKPAKKATPAKKAAPAKKATPAAAAKPPAADTGTPDTGPDITGAPQDVVRAAVGDKRFATIKGAATDSGRDLDAELAAELTPAEKTRIRDAIDGGPLDHDAITAALGDDRYRPIWSGALMPSTRDQDRDAVIRAALDAQLTDDEKSRMPGAGAETPTAGTAAPAGDQAGKLPGGAANLGEVLRSTPVLTTTEDEDLVRAYLLASLGDFDDPKSGITAKARSVNIADGKITMRWRLMHGRREIGSTKRRILVNSVTGEPYVNNEHLEIDDAKLRGAGFAARFNRRTEAFLLDNEIHTVRLTANINVGGYAWARDGFDFENVWGAETVAGNLETWMVGRYDDDFNSAAAVLIERARAASAEYDHLMRSGTINARDAEIKARELAPTPLEFAMLSWTPETGHGKAAMWPGKRFMLTQEWQGAKDLRAGTGRPDDPAAAGTNAPEAPGVEAWAGQNADRLADLARQAKAIGGTDPALAELGRENGWGTPAAGAPDALEAKIADGWTPIFRGVRDYTAADGQDSRTADEIADDFRGDPDYQPGLGLYGNGTYFSADTDTAAAFATGQATYNANPAAGAGGPGVIVAGALDPDARVADYEDLVAEQKAWQAEQIGRTDDPDQGARLALEVGDDLGRFAAIRGYDAIRVRDQADGNGASHADQYVILNRERVMVTDPSPAGDGNPDAPAAGGARIPGPDGERPNPREDPAGWAAASTDAELADTATKRGLLPRVKKAIAEEQRLRSLSPDEMAAEQRLNASVANPTRGKWADHGLTSGDRVIFFGDKVRTKDRGELATITLQPGGGRDPHLLVRGEGDSSLLLRLSAKSDRFWVAPVDAPERNEDDRNAGGPDQGTPETPAAGSGPDTTAGTTTPAAAEPVTPAEPGSDRALGDLAVANIQTHTPEDFAALDGTTDIARGDLVVVKSFNRYRTAVVLSVSDRGRVEAVVATPSSPDRVYGARGTAGTDVRLLRKGEAPADLPPADQGTPVEDLDAAAPAATDVPATPAVPDVTPATTAAAAPETRPARSKMDDDQYRKDYERGWRTSKTAGSDSLERGDARNEPEAWYDGWSDYSVDQPKWSTPRKDDAEERARVAGEPLYALVSYNAAGEPNGFEIVRGRERLEMEWAADHIEPAQRQIDADGRGSASRGRVGHTEWGPVAEDQAHLLGNGPMPAGRGVPPFLPRGAGDQDTTAGTNAPAAPAAADTAAPVGELADLPPADQARIRNVVADLAAKYAANPMVKGNADDVARYLSEGELTKVTDQHGLRTVWAAVAQALAEDPGAMTRSAGDINAARERRAADSARLNTEAAAAARDGDFDRSLALIGAGEQADPDFRTERGRSWEDLRVLIGQRREKAAADNAAAADEIAPAAGTSAPDAGPAAPETPAAAAVDDGADPFAAMLTRQPKTVSRAETGDGTRPGATEVDMFGNVTAFVPARREAIGLSDRPEVGRTRAIAAAQQLSMLDKTEASGGGLGGEEALFGLFGLFDMPPADPPALPAGAEAPALDAPEPDRRAALTARVLAEDLDGWTDEQLTGAFMDISSTTDALTADEEAALQRIDDRWENRTEAMQAEVDAVPEDLTTLSDDDAVALLVRLTSTDGPLDEAAVARVDADLDRREAEAVAANETAELRERAFAPTAEFTEHDQFQAATDAARDLGEWDRYQAIFEDWETFEAREAAAEEAARVEAARVEAERVEAARVQKEAAAAREVAAAAEAERVRTENAMIAARAAAAIPPTDHASVRSAHQSLGEDATRRVIGAERYDAIAAAADNGPLQGEDARKFAIRAALLNLPEQDKVRLVMAAAEIDTPDDVRAMSDMELMLETLTSRVPMAGETADEAEVRLARVRAINAEQNRRGMIKVRDEGLEAFARYRERLRTAPVGELTDVELAGAPGTLAGDPDSDLVAKLGAIQAEADRRQTAAADRANRKAAGPAAPAKLLNPIGELGSLTMRTESYRDTPYGQEAGTRLLQARALTVGLPATSDEREVKKAERADERSQYERDAWTIAWYRHLAEFADIAEQYRGVYWVGGPADDEAVAEVPLPLPGAKVSKPTEVWEAMKQQAIYDRRAGINTGAERYTMALARSYGIPFDREDRSEAAMRKLGSANADAMRGDTRTATQQAASFIAEWRRLAAEDGVDPSNHLLYGPPDKRPASLRRTQWTPTADETIRVDRLVAGGMDWDEAYAEVLGIDPDDLRREQAASAATGSARPTDKIIKAHYADHVARQYADAEAATNGYLLTKTAQAKGVDPASLFSGDPDRAYRLASEELMRFWGEPGNQRLTYTEYKAQMVGDGRAARASAAQSRKGNEFA